METKGSGWGCLGVAAAIFCVIWLFEDSGGCKRYYSKSSCDFVVDEAIYDVWYWKNLNDDNEEDNQFIGQAVGIRMCEGNAQRFSKIIGEEWNYRSYLCITENEGRIEKHRSLETD